MLPYIDFRIILERDKYMCIFVGCSSLSCNAAVFLCTAALEVVYEIEYVAILRAFLQLLGTAARVE